MKNQPWIHKAKTDTFFILLPSFFALFCVVIFNKQISMLQNHYPFHIWLFLIVFIDVAHVYSTLYKTYFVSSEFKKRKQLYIFLPIVCFLIGLILHAFGSLVFWSVLAYVAVFHFIRQQYGFVRLYSKNDPKTFWNKFFDSLIIYSVTIYPMITWFFSPNRQFNWFVKNEFFHFENKFVLEFSKYIYFTVIIIYFVRVLYFLVRKNIFNIPKNLIIIGTGLSWYFGIVYYNNDLIFTLLNVVSHGIPYMALIFLKEINNNDQSNRNLVLINLKKVLFFLLSLFVLAFFEEFIWEIMVWNEFFTFDFDFYNWHFIVVPLLAVPQFTHYLLDGFIWKNNK